jgi:hypothetical protein
LLIDWSSLTGECFRSQSISSYNVYAESVKPKWRI